MYVVPAADLYRWRAHLLAKQLLRQSHLQHFGVQIDPVGNGAPPAHEIRSVEGGLRAPQAFSARTKRMACRSGCDELQPEVIRAIMLEDSPCALHGQRGWRAFSARTKSDADVFCGHPRGYEKGCCCNASIGQRLQSTHPARPPSSPTSDVDGAQAFKWLSRHGVLTPTTHPMTRESSPPAATLL